MGPGQKSRNRSQWLQRESLHWECEAKEEETKAEVQAKRTKWWQRGHNGKERYHQMWTWAIYLTGHRVGLDPSPRWTKGNKCLSWEHHGKRAARCLPSAKMEKQLTSTSTPETNAKLHKVDEAMTVRQWIWVTTGISRISRWQFGELYSFSSEKTFRLWYIQGGETWAKPGRIFEMEKESGRPRWLYFQMLERGRQHREDFAYIERISIEHPEEYWVLMKPNTCGQGENHPKVLEGTALGTHT